MHMKLKVKGHLLVPVGFVCLQYPLDTTVDLLAVGWNGLTGLESEGKEQRMTWKTINMHTRLHQFGQTYSFVLTGKILWSYRAYTSILELNHSGRVWQKWCSVILCRNHSHDMSNIFMKKSQYSRSKMFMKKSHSIVCRTFPWKKVIV